MKILNSASAKPSKLIQGVPVDGTTNPDLIEVFNISVISLKQSKCGVWIPDAKNDAYNISLHSSLPSALDESMQLVLHCGSFQRYEELSNQLGIVSVYMFISEKRVNGFPLRIS